MWGAIGLIYLRPESKVILKLTKKLLLIR